MGKYRGPGVRERERILKEIGFERERERETRERESPERDGESLSSPVTNGPGATRNLALSTYRPPSKQLPSLGAFMLFATLGQGRERDLDSVGIKVLDLLVEFEEQVFGRAKSS